MAAGKTSSDVIAAGNRRHGALKRRLRRSATVHPFVWRHLTLSVKHTPDYLERGWSHVELLVIDPEGAPCPLTATGYRSHFLEGAELDAAGGPIAFMAAWLEREAKTKAWAKREALWRQLDLFG